MNSHPLKKIGDRLRNREIKIRPATTSDLGSMTSLLGELFSIEKDFTANVRKQRLGLATLMASEDATMLVAVLKREIIGMCTLQPLISTAEGGTVGMVEDLVVAASYRGKGIGAMLLDAIEIIAREQGMTRLQLLTDKDNEGALRFYDNHQWQRLNLIPMRKRID